MKLTTVVKLHTSEEEHAALVETLRTCNATCDRISRIAFEHKTFRKFDLHHLTYHNIRAALQILCFRAKDLECREAASFLAAGHVVCAIAKVANAYKAGADVLRTFDPTGGIEFNKDTLAWKVEEQTVSVNTACGRLKLRFLCSPGQKELLHGKRGQADLLLRKGQFYLSVATTVRELPLFEHQGVIGIDLGIVQIATDSEGNQYSGEPVKKVRKKCRRLRKLLQPRKTRSARKHLQKAGKRESRFVKDVNHCISKNLVQLALDRQKALACEDLSGIRERGNSFNRAMRTELNNWAFHQLKLFLAYKCQRAGVTLIEVDPRYSSQTCSGCGHCERGNRKSQERFECLSCGLKLNADVNSALNLKARGELSAALMFRLDALCFQLGTSRPL